MKGQAVEKGDLSNQVQPKILIVFEEAVAHLSPAMVKDFEKAMAKERFGWAAAFWNLDDLMVRKIEDLIYRQDKDVQLITFYPQELAEQWDYLLEENDVPVGDIKPYKLDVLARKVALMQDVAAVYDPDPAHQFTYGAKGRVLTSPHDL